MGNLSSSRWTDVASSHRCGAPPDRHLLEHGRRHHVAGRQAIGNGRAARIVHDDRAGAPQRLGDQGALPAAFRVPQDRRVELDELDVAQRGPRSRREREPVTGHSGRVGRRGVGLPESAGGQHDRPGPHHSRDQRRLARTGQTDQQAAIRQVERHRVREQRNRAGQQCAGQHPVHLGPHRVAASVHDPAAAVPALQVPVPEPRAQRRQPRDHFRRLGHQRGHGRRIAQPGARRQCVLGVQRDRIIRVEHRRHAALGERGGPAAELVLREKQHPPAARRCRRCSGNQRRGHPGGARPYHDYICVA